MTKKPAILVTNDDGVHAPGIRHLWECLTTFADVTVVAPAVEQSAVGLCITLRAPLRVEKLNWGEGSAIWSVSGTPADSVKMALSKIMSAPPDLVVSGINKGANSGRNVLYSGTVGGAIEAVMHEIPSIAFSCYDYFNPGYANAREFIPKIVEDVLKHGLSHGTLLNVNFPGVSHGRPKGVKLVRQGKEYWMEDPDERLHPHEGHSYYWLGARLAAYTEHEESDVAWLKKGFITAVPVHVSELTDHLHLEKHKARFDALF